METIELRDEVYERLESEKGEEEDFSAVISRLLDESETDWREGFGTIDSDEADKLLELTQGETK
jgi:predicted CopG family antitoxin